jgi:hypothetical protein
VEVIGAPLLVAAILVVGSRLTLTPSEGALFPLLSTQEATIADIRAALDARLRTGVRLESARGSSAAVSRVERGSGAAAVGRAYLFPPHSSGGALVARPAAPTER